MYNGRTRSHTGIAEELQQGIRAARAGRKAEARAAFRVVLRGDPFNETALLWLAFLSEDPRASLSYIARALEAHPKSSRAHAALRWARRRAGASPPPAPTDVRRESPLPKPPRTRGIYRTVAGMGLVLGLVLLLMGVVRWGIREPARPQPVAMAALSTLSPSPSPSSSPTPTAPLSILTPTPEPPTPTPSPSPTPTDPHILPGELCCVTPIPTPTPSPIPTPVPPAPTPLPPTPLPPATVVEERWIDVDLTHQVLTAYEGSTPVRTIRVSTGLPNTPTPVGQFRIWVKLRYDDMEGPGYYLPDVPYVMYFYGPYGLHGTYWHNNFGQPMSHGCVNLPTSEAEWLFNWAEVGTLVNIHH